MSAILVAALSAGLIQFAVPLNWDVAWLSYLAREANKGVPTYRTFVEINPPLQIWLLQPVVALAALLGIPVAAMVKWVLFGVAIALVCVLTRVAPVFRRGGKLWGVAIGAIVLPMDQFGQRDHLAALLLLPAVAVVGLRRAGLVPVRQQAIGAGVLAGLAMALKPHYVVLLPILAWPIAQSRPGRERELKQYPEFWLPPVLLGAYFLIILIWFSDYIAQARTFGSYYLDWHQAQFYEWLQPLTFAAIGVGLGWGIVRRNHPDRAVGDTLLVTTIGFFVAAVIQGKGFAYHLLPAAIAAFTLLPLVVAGKQRVVSALVCVVAGIAIYQGFRWAEQARARVATITAILRTTEARTVLVATHAVRTAWPVVLIQDVGWASSFPSTWWMSRMVEAHAEEIAARKTLRLVGLTPIENRLLGRFTNDLVRNRPDLILTYVPDTRIIPYQIGFVQLLTLNAQATRALSDYVLYPGGDRAYCLYVRRDRLQPTRSQAIASTACEAASSDGAN